MDRVAIPFSDPASGSRAVAALLRAPRDAALEVELVALVDPLRPGKVAVFVPGAIAAAQAREAASRWLEPLARRLAQAGVRHHVSVALGPARRTLRHLAARRDLARIVMAAPDDTPWRNRWRQWALRSAQPVVTVVP
jgi:hypothetical protein